MLPTGAPPFGPTFVATDVVFDVRTMAKPTSGDADRVVMGGVSAASAGVLSAFASTPPPATPPAKHVANVSWATTMAKVEDAALTAPKGEASRVVRDVMLENYRGDLGNFIFTEPVFRFPVLTHWSFTVSGAGGFESYMRGLDVGLLGTAAPEPIVPPGAPPPPPPSRSAPEFTETGHVGLPHLTRRGERVRAWYRGPLASHPTTRDEPDGDGHLPIAHVSDQLRRVVPDGREDLSLAGAFEIGRLLALSQLSIVRALMAWRAEQFGAERAKQIAEAASDAATIVKPALTAPAPDLGALIGRTLMLAAAEQPDRVFAPSRPLADPGRPLPFAHDGGLEALIAEGFGLRAADVSGRTKVVGPVAALQHTAVPVVESPAGGPALDGASVERLRASLTSVVDRLTEDALPNRVQSALAPPGRRRAFTDAAAADALDNLIARANRRSE